MGIQSFEEAHLKLMNRAHTAEEAIKCVRKAQDVGIQKISIDLIYGIPGMDLTTWKKNLQKAILLDITHISSYCLTIEPKTVFGNRTEKKQLIMPEEGETSEQFDALIDSTEAAGFEHYEVSNFAKNKDYAIHNTNYWNGVSYLGIGPGAHSYFPGMRMRNIANNQHYVKALDQNELPLEKEILSNNNQFNEYLMTGLRTQWGIDLQVIEAKFGLAFVDSVLANLSPYLKNEQAIHKNNNITLSKKGRFFADGIAAAAFIID
jgi:oxygen-independent coproporphyrinogen-3 oxidase